MKTIFKLSAAAALLAATAAPAFAASVLTVDFNKVFSDSAAAKSGTSQLHAKYDTQIQQRNTALQTAAQAFQAQLEDGQIAGAVRAGRQHQRVEDQVDRPLRGAAVNW